MWAKERLYPVLKSNNLLGEYEYTNFPMDPERLRVKEGDHIPGEVIHDYLDDYARRFNIARKIRLRTKVRTVEKDRDRGWVLGLATDVDNSSPQHSNVFAKKLIVATGLTSEPRRVEFSGMDQFDGPIIHSKDFKTNQHILEKSKAVTVLGGHKSAWDMAYASAASGCTVDWVIRGSGQGPTWIISPWATPLRISLGKLLFTRLVTFFSPSLMGADGFGWFRQLLHGTVLGRFFVSIFWKLLEMDAMRISGYNNHPETRKLKPWYSIFWLGCSLGVHNFPTDIFEMIKKGRIRIHIADIERLSAKEVHLSDGEVLFSDAIICATGWKPGPSMEFIPADLTRRLGLPHQSDQENDLALAADRNILNQFPSLRNQPVLHPEHKASGEDQAKQKKINEPFRLYRYIAPPDAELMKLHNIGFVGMGFTVGSNISAQMQSLWLTAYLGGDMKIDQSTDQVLWETTLHSQFQKWRHPTSYGNLTADIVYECLPYYDLLLDDLGLKVYRKRNRVAEWITPYGPADYQKIVEEWKEKKARG